MFLNSITFGVPKDNTAKRMLIYTLPDGYSINEDPDSADPKTLNYANSNGSSVTIFFDNPEADSLDAAVNIVTNYPNIETVSGAADITVAGHEGKVFDQKLQMSDPETLVLLRQVIIKNKDSFATIMFSAIEQFWETDLPALEEFLNSITNITFTPPGGFSKNELSNTKELLYSNSNNSTLTIYLEKVGSSDADSALTEIINASKAVSSNYEITSDITDITVAGRGGKVFDSKFLINSIELCSRQILIEDDNGGFTIIQYNSPEPFFEVDISAFEEFLISVSFE